MNNVLTENPYIENGGILFGSIKDKYYINGSDTHTMVIGATRSGKSRSVVLPSIGILGLAGENMIVSDPKGELHQYTYPCLERLGYSVYVLDFKNPERSDHFNFLQEVIDAVNSNNIPLAQKKALDITEALVGNDTSSEKICVYICLARYVAEDNCCRVSQHLIAEKCSISLVSVIRAVKELKSANMLETIKQTNINNNGNYVLLYRLTDGTEYKNVIRRKLDVENTSIANAHMKIYRNLNVIEKRLNGITMPVATPLHMTYSPYVSDTPPELYLY